MFWRARIKLAAFYAVALALTVFVIGTVVYIVVERSLDQQIDSSIRTAQAQLLPSAAVLSNPGSAAPRSGLLARGGLDTGAARAVLASGLATDLFFVVTDSRGAVVANPRQIDASDIDFPDLVSAVKNGKLWRDVSVHGQAYRLETTPLPANSAVAPDGDIFTAPRASGTLYLSVGRSINSRDSQLATLLWVLVAGGGIAVILSGAGGLWLAGRALGPIRESVEMQRRFLSDVSHELRTPIAVIRANNELLLRHAESTIESNLDQVEAVAEEAEQMTRMIDDLLTLARADEGRLRVEVVPIDLGRLADEVVRDMAAVAEHHGIALSATCSATTVVGDRGRLRQLALILIDNAIKYTPPGGSVRVHCRRSGGRVELAVEDTGPGIARDDQQRIFDRFFRAEKSRSRGLGGTGLGLAIASRIAEAHGGRISVASEPGHGSTFTVRLPADGEDRHAVEVVAPRFE